MAKAAVEESVSGGRSVKRLSGRYWWRRIREIVAYAAFCRTVESVSDEFYRRTAIQDGKRDAYIREMEKAVRTLWP